MKDIIKKISKNIFIFPLLLAMLTLVIGASYAYYEINLEGRKELSLNVQGGIGLTYSWNEEIKNLTSLDKKTDDEGKNLDTYYSFKVSATATKKIDKNYLIYIEEIPQTNQISNTYVKMYLTDDNDNMLKKPTIVANLLPYQEENTYKLFVNGFSFTKTGTKTHNYRLRTYISEEFEQEDESVEYIYKYKVKVLFTEEEKTSLDQEGIYISNIVCKEDTNPEKLSTIINVHSTRFDSNIVLSNFESASITYTITIKNDTNINYSFVGVDKKSYNNEKIIFELSGLSKGDVLYNGSSITFDITFKFADVTPSTQINELESYLNFTFGKFTSVTYVGIDGTNYPSKAVEGDSFNVVFSSAIVDNVSVNMNSNDLNLGSDYTFDDKKTLVIEKVEGNIIITAPSFGQSIINANNKSSNNSNCPEVVSSGTYKSAYISKEEVAKITASNYTYPNESFCSLPDDYGMSYYFRGNVNNNYVDFAGITWRIVRVNGDGSVRIVHNDQIGEGQYNIAHNRNAYVGYMYGSVDASATYDQSHTNTISSSIKDALEGWFAKTELDTTYDEYISDTLFCNDRSLYTDSSIYSSLNGYRQVEVSNEGGGSNKGFYGGFYRLVFPMENYNTAYGGSGNSSDKFSVQYPTLQCYLKKDRFTKDDTIIGNGKLTQKVGTLTADEIVLAGSIQNAVEINSYLTRNYSYWTMTPNWMSGYAGQFNSAIAVAKGWLSGGSTTSSSKYYVPVINIASNVVVTDGNGSSTKPYKLAIIK